MKTIKVDKVILYYMDRVDPDGNLYRFYMYKGMASEIGRVMGEHYYNKFVHEFDGNILKMVGYFRGSEKEGQVFCDMITERIEKYEQRESYNRSKLNN